MGEFFPTGFRGEGFKILKGVAVQGFISRSDDTAEIDQGLLIHLILAEQADSMSYPKSRRNQLSFQRARSVE
jgi:hypothetical protein